MKKELLTNFGLSLATIVFFFTATEVFLRIAGLHTKRFDPPRIYTHSRDPRISYELKPNIRTRAFRSEITTNSLGFRSEEPDGTKPVIAVLGDSIAFGYGLEDHETIPARLQELLPLYSVQNGGVPGYFLPQEAALYEVKMAPLQPVTLILIFFFNDLEAIAADVASEEGFIHPPGWEYTEPACSPIENGIFSLIPGRCWLDLHSALYGIIKKIITRRSTHEALQKERQSERENGSNNPLTGEELTRYARQLHTFSRILPPDLPRLFIIWPEHLMHRESRPALKAIAKANGFRVLDLYEIFGNEPEMRKGDAIHPSAKTAREAAEAIRGALDRYQLLP